MEDKTTPQTLEARSNTDVESKAKPGEQTSAEDQAPGSRRIAPGKVRERISSGREPREAKVRQEERDPDTGSQVFRYLADVNKELWLILSVFSIAAVMNHLVAGHRMVLGFYTLPTLFSAYFYGRRHATLTAFASVFLVGLLARYNPGWFTPVPAAEFLKGHWFDITAWGGILVVTAYTMGTLHDRHKARMRELRRTYQGLLLILRQFISKDRNAESHSYRVSVYVLKIGAYLGFNTQRTEDLRAAALLHDIGKLDISRDLINKAACLTEEEYDEVGKHAGRERDLLRPLGGPLRRILPIIFAHDERFDASSDRRPKEDRVPLEARVIAIADAYDSLTSDLPHRRAMSPFDAKETIVRGSGNEFDPQAVEAFLKAFRKGEMEVSEFAL